MEHEIDSATFETLIHLLEVSVVLGIGVIVYITKKYSGKVNKDLEKKIDEMDTLSEE
jgi:hypothetical protein